MKREELNKEQLASVEKYEQEAMKIVKEGLGVDEYKCTHCDGTGEPRNNPPDLYDRFPDHCWHCRGGVYQGR